MRKSFIERRDPGTKAPHEQEPWLDLDKLAAVEITSEDPLFPVEDALGLASSKGWRAASKGPQFIRLNFDKPTAIRRILVHFVDRERERSQEFSIHAKNVSGEMREVVRQQFSFSPGGATEELEEYEVELAAVSTLQICIDPDRAHDPAHSHSFAVLQRLRLA